MSSEILNISGWACSGSGIAAIDLHVDGHAVRQIETGILREDVGKHYSDIHGADRSGFSTAIRIDDLSFGAHELALAVHARSGNTQTLTRTFRRIDPSRMYHSYYTSTLLSGSELTKVKHHLSAAPSLPQIELWVDLREGGDLASTLRSIRDQDYPAWRCAVFAGDTDRQRVQAIVDRSVEDPQQGRFRVIERAAAHEDRDSDTAWFCGFLRAGETLAPHALYLYALYGSNADNDVIYSDHDMVQAGGWHVHPHFKPDWSPDYLLSRNYVGGFFLARNTKTLRRLLHERIEAGRPGWRFDLLLGLTDGANEVVHIPRVLWSAPFPYAEPDQEYEAERIAVKDALKRRGLAAEVLPANVPGVRRVQWRLTEDPTVSVIIPTTGRMDHLRPCVESFTQRTAYRKYELIFVDNGRGEHPEGITYLRSLGLRVVERNEPFNYAKLNNDGAKASSGDLLLFLNDDVEIIEEDWLIELVVQAMRPDIGAVGALLLYPNGCIQHAGAFLVGHGGGTVHFFHGLDPEQGVYLDLHRLSREVSANTGACLMVHRARFNEVDGFDEDLAIVGNDVDLCLRLAERGYRSIWTPYSKLVHHESASRRDSSIILDEKKVWDRWGDLLRSGGPYYNPNFAQDRPDCSVDWSKVKDLEYVAPAKE
ncbi:MAG: glycosyltransferase family 2 protein, partial [Planctomycetota bacterium]